MKTSVDSSSRADASEAPRRSTLEARVPRAAKLKELVLVVLISTALLFPVACYLIDKFGGPFGDSLQISGRVTTGTVVKKAHVRFDKNDSSYVTDDGITVRREAGDEEWRVYFQIDSFDQIHDSTRTLLTAAEDARLERFGPRSWDLRKEQYNRIRKGDKLRISWRLIGSGRIEIWSVQTP